MAERSLISELREVRFCTWALSVSISCSYRVILGNSSEDFHILHGWGATLSHVLHGVTFF